MNANQVCIQHRFPTSGARLPVSAHVFRWAGITIVLAICCPAHASADPIKYVKDFVLTKADKDAAIFAGGQVQTWAGSDIVNATHTIWKAIKTEPYAHASPTKTGDKMINGGFGFVATNPPVESGIKATGKTLNDGWTSLDEDGHRTTVKDNHTLANSAEVGITITGGLRDLGLTVWNEKKKDHELQMFPKATTATLTGEADAGRPLDADRYHSADSFAAAYVDKADIFRYSIEGDQDARKFTIAQANRMVGGAAQNRDKNAAGARGGVSDPYFFDLVDLDTGAETVEVLMTQMLDFNNALFSIDDAGIRFTIDPNDPESMVSLVFSSEFPWVSNPYRYSIRLDPRGLAVSGDRFALAGWQLSSSADGLEAFFPFGPEGLAFDMAEVEIPTSLLVDGHTYGIGAGSSNGAYVIETADAAAVPEPSTLGLLGLGIAGLIARTRKQLAADA